MATLHIADHIAAGITDIDALASAANCDPVILHCVMGHLVSKGLFEEPEPGRFALNDMANELRQWTPSLDLKGIGGRMAHAWGSLLTFVRTGASGYDKVFGLPFWEDLDAHPDVAASFDALIGPGGHSDFSPDFEITGGWDSLRTVVDVGGGTGAMLAAILRARPHIHGTLVELPRTVERSAALFESAGVADRVTAIGQSFFDPLPPKADLYLLRGVLNNWPDREAIALLTRGAEAARPNGRVVILKSIGPDSAPKDIYIDMVLTGGRQRTVEEFRTLAAPAGLKVIAAARQPAYFVVECETVSIDRP